MGEKSCAIGLVCYVVLRIQGWESLLLEDRVAISLLLVMLTLFFVSYSLTIASWLTTRENGPIVHGLQKNG